MDLPLRTVFAGTPEFARPALAALARSIHRPLAVFTQPERPAGRGRKQVPSPVKRAAEEYGIPVYQPTRLDAEAQHRLTVLAPDVLVVVAYGLLLPPAVLAIPRLGCLNIHASLLPRWRGAAPIARAVLAGDRETGVSFMQMEAGLDTGPVLSELRCPIAPQDSAGQLHDRLAELGAAHLVEVLEAWAAGRVTPVPQATVGMTYAAKLSKEEAVLDWCQPARQLAFQVRAYNPRPVAYTLWQGTTLRVWNARVASEYGTQAGPGTVMALGGTGIDVATGEGVLTLIDVQAPGGRVIAAADFARARPGLRGAVVG